MKWNVAILLCCSVALGQSSSKAVQHLPEALTSVLAEVKAKSHLEVLLPSELPHPFGEAKYAIVESASQNEYGISLYYKLDVGDSGFAAFFSANGHPGYGPKDIPNVREVNPSHVHAWATSAKLAAEARAPQLTSGGKRITSYIFSPVKATA